MEARGTLWTLGIRPTPSSTQEEVGHMRMRLDLAAAAVVAAIVLAPPASTAASFTASTVSDAGSVTTATLSPVTSLTASRTAEGRASVSWQNGDTVDIERSVGGVSSTIRSGVGEDTFMDDLTVDRAEAATTTARDARDTSSCLIAADDDASCWGDAGRLGNGAAPSAHSVPADGANLPMSDNWPMSTACLTGWVLTPTDRCAPGADIAVVYTVTNRLGG